MNWYKITKFAEDPRENEELLNKELKAIRDRWEIEGIQSFAYVKNGDITLNQFIIPKEKRGQGIGTSKMQELKDFAAKYHLRILLTPATDFGATSKRRLESFYRNLGFARNSGQNKDYRTRETMIWRYPDYKKYPS